MAKLTKSQIKSHNAALRLLEKDKLTLEDKVFVLENWNEGAVHVNSAAGAFFTPPGLARDFAIEVTGRRIIDLCAGIGALSFAVRLKEYEEDAFNITCVEINPAYVEVGKKILPNAAWICGSIFDAELDSLPKFDCAISNPPFGSIKTGRENDGLGGFEFSAIKRAAELAKRGVFIVPQMSAPFQYSGRQCYERSMPNNKVKAFIEKTGLMGEIGCGIDTSQYLRDWHGVSPMCEVVLYEFNSAIETKPTSSHQHLSGSEENNRQLTLF